jgi:prophage tail gpP-like protein
MITLEIDGIRYTGFKTISVERSLENVSGAFNMSAVFSSNLNFPIKIGAQAKVLVNSTPIMTGFVEVMNIQYDAMAHNITIQGRDRTCDINDSQVDGDIEFLPPISLENVIKQTLSKININDINVINEAGSVPPFNASELVSSRIGQTAFNFVETYARKRQVFVTTDGKGNVLLARGSTASLPTGLYNQIGDPNRQNNILNSSVQYDQTERFNTYRCKSQGNISVLNFTGETAPSEVTARGGVAVDTGIRNTRILNFNAENSSDNVETVNRAKWEANIRRARSFTYTAKVQGDTYDGTNPWITNRLVQVIDDFASINAALLIKKVIFEVSVDNGTTTTLELVTPDGYQPEPERSASAQKSNKIGEEYYILKDKGT